MDKKQVDPCTLIVKHLPDLADNAIKEFFDHFGAKDVKTLAGRMKGTAYVSFSGHDEALSALHKLSGLSLLSKTLKCEFAHSNNAQQNNSNNPRNNTNNPNDNENSNNNNSNMNTHNTTPSNNTDLMANYLKSRQRSINPDPLAPSLGLTYPSNPYLEYSYPAATPHIIHNIMCAIIAVPRLYTQVLHLMNKMNLPPPFGASAPELPSFPAPSPPPPSGIIPVYSPNVRVAPMSGIMPMVPINQIPSTMQPSLQDFSYGVTETKKKDELLSSSESEIESEGSGDESGKRKGILTAEQAKLLRPKATKKRKLTTNPTTSTTTTNTNTNTSTNTNVIANTNTNIITTLTTTPTPTSTITPQLTPIIAQQQPQPPTITTHLNIAPTPLPQNSTLPAQIVEQASRKVISLADLEANRLTGPDLDVSLQKNPLGVPSIKLYVKNLAKNVTEQDLEFIFGRYFSTDEEMKKGLEINLMKEGRMKGQAFIKFPNAELAQQALNEVNGYKLQEKPMVIQFGKQ